MPDPASQNVTKCLIPRYIKPLARVLGQAFARVYLLLCPDEEFAGSDNNLLIATDARIDALGFIELNAVCDCACRGLPERVE